MPIVQLNVERTVLEVGATLVPNEDAPEKKHLEVQYLWVDALCILQGNDDAAGADWQNEFFKMAELYGGAHLTIAAAGAYSCYDGISNQCSLRGLYSTRVFLNEIQRVGRHHTYRE
jgi:hypothetical protein